MADLKVRVEEAFALMSASQSSDYELETIELHVTASAEGGFFITSAGIEGGMKLVFKRR
ncbi:Pepco domain-containing protein [Halomonas colorata]